VRRKINIDCVDYTSNAYLLFILGLFLSVKLAGIFGQAVNPFAPFEAIFWGFLGAFQGTEETAQEKKDN
jgi:hypothetical protein